MRSGRSDSSKAWRSVAHRSAESHPSHKFSGDTRPWLPGKATRTAYRFARGFEQWVDHRVCRGRLGCVLRAPRAAPIRRGQQERLGRDLRIAVPRHRPPGRAATPSVAVRRRSSSPSSRRAVAEKVDDARSPYARPSRGPARRPAPSPYAPDPARRCRGRRRPRRRLGHRTVLGRRSGRTVVAWLVACRIQVRGELGIARVKTPKQPKARARRRPHRRPTTRNRRSSSRASSRTSTPAASTRWKTCRSRPTRSTTRS